jgi:hypothetical protein
MVVESAGTTTVIHSDNYRYGNVMCNVIPYRALHAGAQIDIMGGRVHCYPGGFRTNGKMRIHATCVLQGVAVFRI